VHLDLRCVDLAERRRAFPRALRLVGPLDVTPVRDHVVEALAQQVDQQDPFSSDSRPPTATDQSGSPR
jgi:hypothetical protein